MQVQMAVDIKAPPEKVWPYLVEPDKAMQWYTMLKKFEYTSEHTGPDSTFYWEEDVRGKTYSNHFRTTEWVENQVFAYEMSVSTKDAESSPRKVQRRAVVSRA